MKKQMEILQSAQPVEGRAVAGGSGYADFPAINDGTEALPTDVTTPTQEGSSSDSGDSPTADKPLLQPTTVTPYTDMNAEGGIVEEPRQREE